MSDYAEIEDPRQLAELNRRLSKKLSGTLRYSETRNVGTPNGTVSNNVRFLKPKGKEVFWWVGKLSRDNNALHNAFGHGAPNSQGPLHIDVQFNLPIGTFLRTRGGAFLLSKKNGHVLMAHRGIVTLGHGRVPMDVLFAEMDATMLEADTSKGPKDFLVIDDIDSPNLIRRISIFSAQVRRTVRSLAARKANPNGRGTQSPIKGRSGLSGLRAYFKEYSGQRKKFNPRTVVADCYHGDVVGALREALDTQPEPLKSREIDLVGYKGRNAFLFEVKTTADTQSVYTAVGQLAVHSKTVVKNLGKLPEQTIVLPEKPIPRLYDILTSELGIRLLTFTRSPKGHVAICGLEKLQESHTKKHR